MLANIFITFVALLHLYFLVLEIFFWDKPLGLSTFKQSYDNAKLSKLLAANQGLYNGFLAAGLLWGMYLGEPKVKIFFLTCVIFAGIFGAFTVNKRILLIQALPAVLALALVIYR
jgi:putative membrane protein